MRSLLLILAAALLYAVSAQAAITRINFAQASPGAVSSITITTPTNTGNGDMMVAQIAYISSATINSVPANWNLIRTEGPPTGGNVKSSLYYINLTGSPGANYTWGCDATCYPSGGIITYRGTATSTPIDVQSGVVSTSNQTSFSTTAIVTGANNEMTVAFWAHAGTSGDTLTIDAALSALWNIAFTTATTFGSGSGDAIKATAGSVTYTSSLAHSSQFIAQAIAIKVAADTPTPTPTFTPTPTVTPTATPTAVRCRDNTQCAQVTPLSICFPTPP